MTQLGVSHKGPPGEFFYLLIDAANEVVGGDGQVRWVFRVNEFETGNSRLYNEWELYSFAKSLSKYSEYQY